MLSVLPEEEWWRIYERAGRARDRGELDRSKMTLEVFEQLSGKRLTAAELRLLHEISDGVLLGMLESERNEPDADPVIHDRLRDYEFSRPD